MANPVIIRLQNLPLEARSIDIRKFFDGLLIPDGGVHIIGGEKGIAFIAFQSDEDARLAMARDGGAIFSSQVKLYLSSKTEMQNVIASARNSTQQQQQQQAVAAPVVSVAPAAAAALTPFNLASVVPQSTTNLDLFTSIASLLSTTAVAAAAGAPKSAAAANLLLSSNKTPFETTTTKTELDLLKSVIQGGGGVEASKPKEDISQTPLSVDQILSLIQNRIPPEALKAVAVAAAGATNDSTSASSASSANDVRRAANERLDEARRGSADIYGSSAGGYSPGGGGGGNDQYADQYNDSRQGRFNDYGDRNRPYYNKYDKFGSKNGGGGNSNFYDKPKRYQQGPANDYDDGKGSFSSRSGGGGAKTRLDPIILVKNFNRNAGYKDMRTFLQGIQIEHDGIKLMTDSTGHRIGMALVKLMGIVDLKKALCRNGQFYEDNMIEVLQSSEDEFANPSSSSSTATSHKNSSSSSSNASSSYHDKRRMNDYDNFNRDDGDLSAHGFFLKIYGLPAKFEESALKNIFNNVKFLQIFTTQPIAFKSNNPADGEAKTTYKAKKICQVETQLDLEKALTRQDERVGKSKLQIYQISKNEFDRELAHAQKNPNNFSNLPGDNDGLEDYYSNSDNGGTGGRSNEPLPEDNRETSSSASASNGPEEAFIHMTGVPFSAHEMDVRTFFQNLNLSRVLILHDVQSCKPIGDVCCSFGSAQDRDKALEKDNQLFRNRVVKVRSIGQDEFHQYLNQEQEVKGRMKPKAYHSQDDQGFYKKSYDNNNSNYNSKYNKNGGGGGGGSFQNFNSSYQYGNNKFRNNGPGPKSGGGGGGYNDFNRFKRRGADSDDQNGGSGYGAKRIRDSSSNEIAIVDLPPLPPELEQHRESLVLLNNVTREATREDILDLFKIYSPIEQSLKIRHNEEGEPTGDVIIACKTPANANKACRFLNGYAFMGRPIKASLIAS